MTRPAPQMRGFTLIELLTALLILSILALTSYRGLGAVLDARDRVTEETEKWRSVAAFFSRIERDMQLAIPRIVRDASGDLPPWLGRPQPFDGPRLEFSRSAAIEGVDTARRVGYRLADSGEIEVWLWPNLDMVLAPPPARFAVLKNVTTFELQYLNADASWVEAWPAREDTAIPRAVRLRIVLKSREELVRVFALTL